MIRYLLVLTSLLYQDPCTSQNQFVASRPVDRRFGLQGSRQGLHAFVILVVFSLGLFALKDHPEFPSTTDNRRITSSINGSPNKPVAIAFGHDQAHNFPALSRHVALSGFKSERRASSDAICKGEKHYLNIARTSFSSPGSARTYSI